MAGFATVDPAVSAINFAWAPATPEEFLARSAPTGVSGAPTLATAERGRTIFEAQVENLCDLIAQSRRVAVTMREVRVPI
jgi:creatinine amidohydrolase/Fe(II)-dependent formamide hydrolase-like protein